MPERPHTHWLARARLAHDRMQDSDGGDAKVQVGGEVRE